MGLLKSKFTTYIFGDKHPISKDIELDVSEVLRKILNMALKLDSILKSLLQKNNLSVPRLSEFTGINVQTLHNWLGGQKPKNIEQVKAVSDFFNCSIEYLCFGEGPKPVETINKYEEEINAGVFEVVLRRIKK